MSINWQIKVLSKVTSTQDIVMLAAQDGDDEGYVIQAMMQSDARGRHGNKWDAPMGNIYMSALLRPECKIERAGELGFVVAIALFDTLSSYIDTDKHKVTLKWPNDILIDGLKISGILLETNLILNKLDGVVVGIGVNIFNAPEQAVSLNKMNSEPVFVNKVRDVVLEKLDKYYSLWQKEGFAPIRKKWLEHAHGLEQPITARLPNESYEGIFSGLTEDGGLILKQGDGSERIITAGDIHFGEEK